MRDDGTDLFDASLLQVAEELLGADLPNSVQVDPVVQQSAVGRCTVHARHQYRGIPLFLGANAVRFHDGAVSFASHGQPAPATDIAPVPVISAKDAVRTATAHLQGRIVEGSACDEEHSLIPAKASRRFRTIASFDSPTRPTVLSRGPFAAHVTAELTIEAARLAWLVTARLRDLSEFIILVGAGPDAAGRILFCRDISSRGCTASIFLFDPDHPRVPVDLPPAMSVYPSALHTNTSTPSEWMEKDATQGNNVETFWGGKRLRIKAASEGANLVFGEPVNALTKEQIILNGFYFCNFMHDFFALLGFSDAEGAFHAVNSTPWEKPNDRLMLSLSPDSVDGLGRMRARINGLQPELILGRGSQGHAALEASVVIHEYVHGVTQRMIGGANNYLGVVRWQTQALGEAWSDFFALTIQNYYRNLHTLPEDWIFARWCTGGNARTASYDGHNGTFTAAGKGLYKKPHHAGEIWAAAAIDFARRLSADLGFRVGYPIAWRAIFDSFGKQVANPTFLDARDALFDAITNTPNHESTLAAAHEAFRARGMGRNAHAPDADRYSSNVENFEPWI